MRQRALWTAAIVSIALAGSSRADFKYSEQSKMTGGALASVTKTLGVFSKSARQANEPQVSTTMVKGNRLRNEHADGTVEIIDLDGRRFIHIDTAKKVYWIQTFDELKQQIAAAQEKVKEEQTKAVARKDKDSAQNVTMVPKFDMQATGQTRVVMNIPAKEVKMRLDMLMQSSDPKTQADLEKSGSSFWMTGDSWYGTIPGYEEVRQFSIKMAKELDWLPGSLGMGNAVTSQAAEEFRKNAIKMDGMPLVQFSSIGVAANGQSGAAGQGSAQPAQTQNQTSSSDSNPPTNAKDAITKGFGSLFAKKKQQQQQNDATQNASASGVPAPPPVPGSMMEVTSQVTSYSTDSLDASLFDVPTGYALVQPDLKTK